MIGDTILAVPPIVSGTPIHDVTFWWLLWLTVLVFFTYVGFGLAHRGAYVTDKQGWVACIALSVGYFVMSTYEIVHMIGPSP